MNREEIIKLAREAGLAVKPPYWGYTEQYHFAGYEQTFEQFVACVEERAAAQEREECAKVVEIFDRTFQTGGGIASAIRARGE